MSNMIKNTIKISKKTKKKTWFCGSEQGFVTYKSIRFQPQVQCIDIMG
jgi:hypothetical protein